jgi:trk system potassium uptake protein TrkA
VTSIKCLSGIDAEAMEVLAKPHSRVTKSPIRKLKWPKGAIIGGIVRDNESYIAVGDFQIQEGDKVVVFTLPEAVHEIDEMFHSD